MTEDQKQLTPVLLRKRIPKLTQRRVAVALDVRESTVSEWERGISKPHLLPSQLKKMMEVYKCDLDDIIEAFEGATEKTAKASTN
jgi:transcriptional regulator with XRE-family HTH domain